MSKHRRAAKIDDNQAQIVKELRAMGYSVRTNVDDIEVGYRGRNYWYEIKRPEAYKKDGTLKAGQLKESQLKLLKEWKGHIRVVSTTQEIIDDISMDWAA